MLINTKYFGTVEYLEDEIISFSDGLFGFEDQKKFLLIRFDNEENSLLCLQSIQDETLSFVVMNPFYLLPEYLPVLTETDIKDLCTEADEELSFYVVCVILESAAESTANLKCPIAMNPRSHTAKQVILDNSSYTLRHPLKQFAEKE